MNLNVKICFIPKKIKENVSIDCIDYVLNDGEDYGLELYIHGDEPFEESIKPEKLIKLLKEEYKDCLKDKETFKYTIEAIDKFLEQDLTTIKDHIYGITVECDPKAVEYLKRNESLKRYTLYIDGIFDINHEDYDAVYEIFKDYPDANLLVDGNNTMITLDQYGKTVEAIDKIVDFIKKQNVSPLEQCMLAYDLVRDRVYKEEDKNESYETSRDLTSVLFGDKIVCAGFANVFKIVLTNLGIKNELYDITRKDNKTQGHRRNIAYVKDDKYEAEGVFYFDTTWDCKNDENDISYLNSYRFFAKQKDEIESYSDKYVDTTFSCFEEGTVFEFEEIVEEKGLRGVPKEMINSLNKVSKFVDDVEVISPLYILGIEHPEVMPDRSDRFDLEKAMERLIRYNELFFESWLDLDKLIDIWLKVRSIENKIDSVKYPLDRDTLKKVLFHSYWDPKIVQFFRFRRNFGITDPNHKFSITQGDLDKTIDKNGYDKKLQKIIETQ